MAITKSRVATKKLGPVSVGNKIIRFKIRNLDRRFTVHEDLICRTSRFFKDRLQEHRKPISTIDECCVCAETLDAAVKDISFCTKCGQNIHEVCIEAWKRSSTTSVNKDSAPTCPMCRASWKNDPLLNLLDIKFDLDPEAVQIYLDWLYTSTLRMPSPISSSEGASDLVMLKLWTVANAVEDPPFKAKVIITYFTEAPIGIKNGIIKWDFVERKCDDEIREFIIDVSLRRVKPGSFYNSGKIQPEAFVREITDTAVARWKNNHDLKPLKKMWMEKLNIEMDPVSDDKVTALLSGKSNTTSAVPEVPHDSRRAAG
ncbi:hypothetical protein AG0111_0g9045 [Alternaria gaisen]|uniref:Uncharacterized protein n=1 Tax=Alternaria gaisen TaxID=167740 RepID=A0ACB6FD98_9PLEO|nr:hypothetical protein AG0111_0g9045 [Alternaria gaisen]